MRFSENYLFWPFIILYNIPYTPTLSLFVLKIEKKEIQISIELIYYKNIVEIMYHEIQHDEIILSHFLYFFILGKHFFQCCGGKFNEYQSVLRIKTPSI